MKLKILVDNNTYIDQYYFGGPAVSYYIEDGDNKILFDMDYSDLYIQNANKLNVPLKDISAVVISHSHNDHTLDYFKKNQIKEIYPCHCVFFNVKATMHQVVPIHELGVGLDLNWS